MPNPFKSLRLPQKIADMAQQFTNAGGRLNGQEDALYLMQKAGVSLNPAQRAELLAQHPDVAENILYKNAVNKYNKDGYEGLSRVNKGLIDQLDGILVGRELDNVARPLRLTDDTTTFGEFAEGIANKDLRPEAVFGRTAADKNMDERILRYEALQKQRAKMIQSAEKKKNVIDFSKFQGLLAPAAATGLLSYRPTAEAQDVGSIQAAVNPTAGAVAQMMQGYNQYMKEHPVIGAIAPRAPEEIAVKMQYGEPRTYLDYVKAFLDLL